jgi:N-methylhydantoinase B
MVKVGDFSVTICDARGRGIGVGQQNMMNPLFYNQMKRVLDTYCGTFEPGDVFMVNDPYSGGSHVPDVLVISPLFWRDRLVAFTVIYSHHTDMGGRFAGSQSGQSTSAYEDGIRIPLVRLARAGFRNDDLVQVIMTNVRASEDFIGDVEAKIAGGWKAGENLTALLDKYGAELFDACCDHLNQQSERAMRAAIASVVSGDYPAQILLADDGLGLIEGGLPIRVTLRFEADHLTVDFTGTGLQVRGGVNMPFENVRGVTISTLRELLVPGVPLNDGLMAPIDIVSPPGTLTNPDFPGATSGRATVFFLVDEVIHRALSRAVPDRVPVPREAWDVMHFSRRTQDGTQLTLMDLFSGGWGGRPAGDGIDGVAQTSTVTLPVELLEHEFPIIIEGFGLVTDTAGAGKYRGSMGVFRSFRFRDTGEVMIRTNRLRPSMGLFGGQAGAPAVNEYTSGGDTRLFDPAGFTHFTCRPGDVLYHRVAGSGGFGNPFEREVAAVLDDVCQQRVSIAAAESVYGVAISGDDGDLRVDPEKTAVLRAPPAA